MKHKGFTIWCTGLSGAGKTTISNSLIEQLKERNLRIEVLDGDIIRQNLSKGLGFSKEDRDINILRIAFVAQLLSRNGVIVIVAAISPYRKIRRQARKMIGDFFEVYCDAPLEACEARDVKGLYARARRGEIKNFTGIDDPYEVPEDAEVVAHTSEETVEKSVDRIIRTLEMLKWIPTVEHAIKYDELEEKEIFDRLKMLGYL